MSVSLSGSLTPRSSSRSVRRCTIISNSPVCCVVVLLFGVVRETQRQRYAPLARLAPPCALHRNTSAHISTIQHTICTDSRPVVENGELRVGVANERAHGYRVEIAYQATQSTINSQHTIKGERENSAEHRERERQRRERYRPQVQ